MIRTTLSIFIILACSALSVFAGGQNNKTSPDGIWQEIDDAALQQRQSQRMIIPNAYRTFSLDMDALRQLLDQAPMEFTEAARNNQVIMTLPMPDGTFAKFRIEESPIMEAGLAAKFPEIKTYRAQGIDDPSATMRFDLMPTGFHAMVLSTHDTVIVDPYAKGDTRNYISFNKGDHDMRGFLWTCGFMDPEDGRDNADNERPDATQVINGSTLRTYRLALAATGEYTVAVGGGTVAGGLAAQVLIMNRVNGVYEKDLAVHMNIIANNNLIVYTNGATDPYSNTSPSALLSENQANCDAVIGTANYDIGHVFSTGGGGLASLNGPCNAGNKAQAETGLPLPLGDDFAIDFVAHEMGHQFGGRHTFNGSVGNCAGGNRTASSAVEPGSGITIMAYAGICGSQDLAAHSIDTMSVKSLEEIVAFKEAGGAPCSAATSTGNTPPVPTGPGNFTIPKGTPFALTASATDINGDSLTYDWNEYDFGPASPPDTDGDGQARPIFRQYLTTVGGTRNFPSLTYILNNANVPPATVGGFLTGEILPSISRTMTFQVVVRDNRANGGGINTATSVLTINGASGPFNITAPNTNINAFGGGNLVVTWNVAGTNGAPVSAANVKISLSTDGGNTFPTVLLASTPNDGSETIVVPNTPSATARIKVEAVGNIFFDISDTNFSIVNSLLAKVADFDGDSKSDLSVFRAGTWLVKPSGGGANIAFPFGLASDTLVPGDYDGDNKTDYAVYRAGVWYVQRSTAGALTQSFGAVGDIPVPGDYDGDFKTDIAVYRPTSPAVWYVLRSSTGVVTAQTWGTTGDLPIRGDFDADTKTDLAVFRPGTGVWYLLRSTAGATAQSFGLSGDQPVPADYDGDGKTDLAVVRNSGGFGIWYILRSTAGFTGFIFGLPGDQPSPGDYDGDNKSDVAVFRPADGSWTIKKSTTSSIDIQPWGASGDASVPRAYLP